MAPGDSLVRAAFTSSFSDKNANTASMGFIWIPATYYDTIQRHSG
jgi:hypothetical protein